MLYNCSAEDLVKNNLEDNSVTLLLTDPPYFQITKDNWDNQWIDSNAYAFWLSSLFYEFYPKLKSNGSIVFFSGLGKNGCHPLFRVIDKLEGAFTFRNWLTWKKRRAYGKSHDYLYVREEILWFSKSKERTEVVFNIPLLEEKRGYKGFNDKYPAKSEFKRVGNVWTDIEDETQIVSCDNIIEDIPELMRPSRSCEKPEKLIRRLVETHSNEGDLVVDCFAGTNVTGRVCEKLNRKYIGCDTDTELFK